MPCTGRVSRSLARASGAFIGVFGDSDRQRTPAPAILREPPAASAPLSASASIPAH
jgi:hypothetical protein